MSDLPILDPQPLRDLLAMGASPVLVQELIALYQEDVPLHMALLRTAMAALDAGQTLMEAHQLKGALGNLGLVRFADLAFRIEAMARAGHLEEVPPLTEAMQGAYEEALHALKAAHPQV